MKSRTWIFGLGGVLLLLALGYLTATLSSRGLEPPVPHDSTIVIARGQVVAIDAGRHVFYYFEVPRAGCTFSGKLTARNATGPTFDALLFSEAGYDKWSAGGKVKNTGSGPMLSWSPSIPLPDSGAYYLVVRNLFRNASKEVAIAAKATCPPASAESR